MTSSTALSGDVGDLARAIAETLDETGYLTVPLEQIAELTGAPLSLVEQALSIVQGLEPPGVGARSLAECLALQAKAADRYDPAMARLIDNLELLSKGRMSDLKRICGVDDEDLADMIRELRSYDPKAGLPIVSQCRPGRFARRVRAPDSRRLCGRIEPGNAAAPAGQPALLSGAQVRAAGQSVARVAQRMPGERGLAGKGARPTRPHDRQGRQRDRETAAGFLRARRVGDEAADLARGRGSHRNARIRPSAASPRTNICCATAASTSSNISSAPGSLQPRATAPRPKPSRREIKDVDRSRDRILSDDAIAGLLKQRGFDVARRTVVKYREAMGIGSSIQRRRQAQDRGRLKRDSRAQIGR